VEPSRDKVNDCMDKPIEMQDKSFFGSKPDNCPEKFKHCGDCNVYPCTIGKPNLND
jgi:hypothetical protein